MPARMRLSITGYNTYKAAIERSTRWRAIVAVTVALVAVFAVAAPAGVVRPPVSGQQPTVKDAVLRLAGPTADLTAVANAISMRHKSLTILVKVRPGLTLTKQVAISIAFDATRMAPQSYNLSNGNQFLYNAPQGNGQRRRVGVAITLTEDKPVVGGVATFGQAKPGGGATFTLPWYVDLDPLFDVAISPLRFTMTSKCDRVGDSEVKFMWYTPEKQYHAKSFHTRKGRLVTLGEFAWARQEVSASANLLWPTWAFIERDSSILSFSPQQWDIPKQEYKLLPGVSGYVGRSLKEASGQGGCYADIAFDMTIQVHKYQPEQL